MVAPERGVDHVIGGLTYGVPVGWGGRSLDIGRRVMVPLGRQDAPTPGYVVEITSDIPEGCDPSRIKPVIKVLEDTGRLTPELIRLGSWIASYYCCPLGMVLCNMLPASVRKGTGRVERKYVRITIVGREYIQFDPVERPAGPRITRLQRAILARANQLPDNEQIEPRDLAAMAGGSTAAPVTKLVTAGLLEVVTRSEVHAAWDSDGVHGHVESGTGAAFVLTVGQRDALDAVCASISAHEFAVHALYGVTGSGKTEVYLRAIDAVRQTGRSAVVLVPEISLTPQTVTRFRARFGDEVAVLHSGLTSAQRHQQWARIAGGAASVVVGARSAVFAPFPESLPLGLIVVDEEHDSSYKQDQAPRYHARDVAIKRAQMINAVVMLGSATPSMETCYNAVVRRAFLWHRLPERVPGMSAAEARIVDMAADLRKGAGASRSNRAGLALIGPTLEHELRRTLTEGGQAILLLNRRGYANLVCCPSAACGWVLYCDECDAAMVLHKDRSLKAGAFVQCHHCQAEQRVPRRCPVCDRAVQSLGVGTQRLEEELCRLYPDYLEEGRTLRRVDSDTMRRAADYHQVLRAFRSGEARVLVGTQILAKGHDFPDVRLVGVINADAALYIPDFRSAERTFQLITQVAGRAGRGEQPGTVIVQTWQPEAPAVRLAAAQDYRTFGRQELKDRQQAGLPPYSRLARIVVRHQQLQKASERADRLTAFLQEYISQALGSPVEVHGPMPCAIARIAGQFRIAIELQSQSAGAIQQVLAAARNKGLVRSDAQTAVDVDPVALM